MPERNRHNYILQKNQLPAEEKNPFAGSFWFSCLGGAEGSEKGKNLFRGRRREYLIACRRIDVAVGSSLTK